MANLLLERVANIKIDFKSKLKPSGWVLPREQSSFADEGQWYVLSPSNTLDSITELFCKRTNIDCDVTPVERRTWSAWTMFGYWFSDALNAQSWMAPAAIITLGLTW